MALAPPYVGWVYIDKPRSINFRPEIKGRFMLISSIVAADGRADELQELLSEIRAATDNEPGTLQYRTIRGVSAERNQFILVEEFTSREAFAIHAQAKESVKVATTPGLIASFTPTFCEEFR